MFMTDDEVNPSSTRTLIVGFSAAVGAATRLLLRQGQPIRSILVIAIDPNQAVAAAALGVRSETGSSMGAVESHLHESLTKVLIDVADDSFADSLVRLVRRRAARARIVVRGTRPDSIPRLVDSGASHAFCDAAIAGNDALAFQFLFHAHFL